MSGIVFYATIMLDKLKDFYLNEIGCKLWMEQEDCIIFRFGNMLIGFCQREEAKVDGLITFVYESRDEVDSAFAKFQNISETKPEFNSKYQIYQFFAYDPEGRMLEFQYFENPVAEFRDGGDLLTSRRSVRKFLEAPIPKDILDNIIDNCRLAPSSHNTQPTYFRIIEDQSVQDALAATRGSSSAPIANAPLAVAICSDPSVSQRHIQDGCIMAYHFILSAWFYGLGTCWIAAMDTDEVKNILNIPSDHYVATVTPLGYPAIRNPKIPERKKQDWFIRN